MRVTFFRVAERKSPKKGRPYCARPFAALRATCDARTEGAPQNSLRATRSVQTTAASQCTKCVCPSAHARTPCPALLGTRRREPRVRTSTRAIASLRCARPHLAGASASRCASWAERSDGPKGCPVPRVPFCACREAQGWGCVRVPQDTRTSLTDSPQLFERSAAGAQRVLRWHPLTEHRRLPRSAAKGTRAAGSLSLW